MFVPKNRTITFRLTLKEYEQFERIADKNGVKISTLIHNLLLKIMKPQ